MNISNRDIKLENTLLHSQGHDRRPMVKLCDFGASPAAVPGPFESGGPAPTSLTRHVVEL